MSNYLFFGDLHLNQSSLIECKEVLDEILSLCKKYNITQAVDLGDTFDVIKPTSLELDLFANFIHELNRPIIILAAKSHESENEVISIVNHFGILSDNVTVVKTYEDDNHLFCGHFIVNESKYNYGGSISKTNLEKYKYVILGHGHNQEFIKPNIVQLGSCRFVDFGESKEITKKVAICQNYKTSAEHWKFIDLKSYYPMIDLSVGSDLGCSIEKTVNDTLEAKSSISQAQVMSKKTLSWVDTLTALDPKTKIRLLFTNFNCYSNCTNALAQFEHKFDVFKIKKDFLMQDNTLIEAKTETLNFKDSLTNWLEKQQVNSQVKEVLIKEL